MFIVSLDKSFDDEITLYPPGTIVMDTRYRLRVEVIENTRMTNADMYISRLRCSDGYEYAQDSKVLVRLDDETA